MFLHTLLFHVSLLLTTEIIRAHTAHNIQIYDFIFTICITLSFLIQLYKCVCVCVDFSRQQINRIAVKWLNDSSYSNEIKLLLRIQSLVSW